MPRDLDGAEASPETLVRAIETVAAADGSAGWMVMEAAQTGMLAGFLPSAVARTFYASGPLPYVAIVTQAAGRAQVVDDGYRVTGRWTFASGCKHATWFCGGAILYDGPTPDSGGVVTS